MSRLAYSPKARRAAATASGAAPIDRPVAAVGIE